MRLFFILRILTNVPENLMRNLLPFFLFFFIKVERLLRRDMRESLLDTDVIFGACFELFEAILTCKLFKLYLERTFC